MAGNAKEWVSDWYSENAYREASYRNPKGPASGVYKVGRGSAFDGSSVDANTYFRTHYYPMAGLRAFGVMRRGLNH